MLETSGKWVEAIAKTVAILGGVVLTFLSIMTVVSITGRSFLWAGLRPVPGDFEMIEAGAAFVVCAFLPWCQLKKGHASVTVITDMLPRRANAVIDLLGEALLLVAALLMTWRHIYGIIDKKAYGETTFILQYPLWWAYAGCLVGLVTWIVVAAWCTWHAAARLDGKEAPDPQSEMNIDGNPQ